MEFFFRNGLAGSTQKTYNSAKNRYTKFCMSNGFPLPTSESLITVPICSVPSQGERQAQHNKMLPLCNQTPAHCRGLWRPQDKCDGKAGTGVKRGKVRAGQGACQEDGAAANNTGASPQTAEGVAGGGANQRRNHAMSSSLTVLLRLPQVWGDNSAN